MPLKIEDVRPAGADHQVISVAGGKGSYRRRPCGGCPWKKESVGEFPAEAFRHSADTAYDMSERRFACHESGVKSPTTCAGFLLRGADHNLSIRLARMHGQTFDDVSDGGSELHANYRSMAIANGVDPLDPALALCRD